MEVVKLGERAVKEVGLSSMSYNGIGLPTPRGSGTSGYIQKNTTANAANRAGVYERRKQNELEAERSRDEFSRSNVSDRRVDKDLIEHEQKRKIEVQCFELRDELEEEGKLSEEQIEEEVQQLRDKLTAASKKKDGGGKQAAKGLKPHQIHELTVWKEKENERLRQAFEQGKKKDRRKTDGKTSTYVDYDSYVPTARSRSRSRSPRRRSKSPKRRQRSNSPNRGPSPPSHDDSAAQRNLRPY
jgi:serine/arginine repetitive matrix protein 2